MDRLLLALRAAAEPTRLRLLALAGRGAFCVTEFTEILAQSQPRLSRHLRLLCDSGLLERVREGANVWFTVPAGEAGALSRELLARLPDHDAILESDRRQAARVLSERARIASDRFRRQGEPCIGHELESRPSPNGSHPDGSPAQCVKEWTQPRTNSVRT